MRISSELTGAIGNLQKEVAKSADRGKKLLELAGQHPFTLYEADLSDKAKQELAKLEDATNKIEGIFVKDLLSKMMPKNAMGTGPMADFARDQYTQAISDIAGKSGSIGIAKMFKQQLSNSIYRTEAARILIQPQEQTVEQKV